MPMSLGHMSVSSEILNEQLFKNDLNFNGNKQGKNSVAGLLKF